MEKLKFRHVAWDEAQLLTEIVADKIRTSGFNPEIIVAVSRGGFDPARILCDQLDIRRLASVQLESYDGMSRSKEPVVVQPVNADIRGRRVIIVDDVSDSGASLIKAKHHCVELGAEETRIASLHIKPWTKLVPDYYAESVDAWVIYPWESRECLLEVVKILHNSGLSGETVVAKLSELGFSRKDIEKYYCLKK